MPNRFGLSEPLPVQSASNKEALLKVLTSSAQGLKHIIQEECRSLQLLSQ